MRGHRHHIYLIFVGVSKRMRERQIEGFSSGVDWNKSITMLDCDRGNINNSRTIRSFQKFWQNYMRHVNLCVYVYINLTHGIPDRVPIGHGGLRNSNIVHQNGDIWRKLSIQHCSQFFNGLSGSQFCKIINNDDRLDCVFRADFLSDLIEFGFIARHQYNIEA